MDGALAPTADAVPHIAPTHPAQVPPDRGDRLSRRKHRPPPRDQVSDTFATLTPAQCAAAAAIIARGASLMLANAAAVHYTEDLSLRWQGIRNRILIREGKYITEGDCSSTATWLLWNALHIPYGIGDVVNGADWTSGNTSTMAVHGRPLPAGAPQRVGDLVLYGPPPADHVAVCLGGGYVFSHGGEAGPFKLPYNYRAVREIRRYFGHAGGHAPAERHPRRRPEHHRRARRSPGPPPWRGRPLSRGSSGARVRAWQQQMRRRGFVLAADGHFGPQTEETCRWLQLYLGHRPATGVVDANVWHATWTAP